MFHNSHFAAPTHCGVLPQNILIFSLSRKTPGIPGRFSVIIFLSAQGIIRLLHTEASFLDSVKIFS